MTHFRTHDECSMTTSDFTAAVNGSDFRTLVLNDTPLDDLAVVERRWSR